LPPLPARLRRAPGVRTQPVRQALRETATPRR
jgi:hypothetical protein